MRFNSCLVAALALSFVAFGQNPKDDDDDEIEVKVVGPEVKILEADDVDVVDLVPMQGLGSIAIGGKQDADEKGKKARKQDDKKKAEKGGTIEREIDLGDGRKMKIIITGGSGEADARTIFGKLGKMPLGGDFKVFEAPKGEFKVFRSPEMLRVEPREFRFEGPRGEARESVDRAMQAFERAIERAREAFARAIKEGEARERRDDRDRREARDRDDDRREAREPREPRRPMIAAPDRDARIRIERKLKEKADRDDADKDDDDKNDRDRKVEAKRMRVGKPDIPFLGVRSTAEAKQSAEIEQLRKEIKELERLVRDLKDAAPAKKD